MESDVSAHWWLSQPGREAHFRSVSDHLPALISLVKPSGELEMVNRPVLDYYNATLEELKRRTWAEAFHSDDVARVNSIWSRGAETGDPYDVEARRRRADGAYRWFRMRGFPLRDTDGQIAYWFVLENDIDDQRQAEALLAGEKRLLEMVALACPLHAILDALCLFVEEMAPGCHCSVMLLDRSKGRLVHGSAPSLPESFNDSIAGRSTPILSRAHKVLGTFAIYCREPKASTAGHHHLIERFTHVASIAIERAESEAELKRSESFLAEAQRLSSTGSFHWVVSTDEVTWSDETYRIFGLDRSQPLTLDRIRSRFHPDDIPLSYQVVDRLRSGISGDVEYEHRLLMPDQSVRHVHIVARATRDENSRLAYTGAIQDVTQWRLSEEALSKARSELAHLARVSSLGALTASIAHEVNQPLSGIMTNAGTCQRMLAADPPNVDGARETARRMIRDANRAFEVIARLRALFGKKQVMSELVNLNEATREVLSLSLSDLQRNRVILHTELDSEIPLISGDRVQLQQVVLNLLLNASEAMSDVNDRPRNLKIKTEVDDGDRVRLSVEDAGVGLDPENVNRLFEPFYTTKSSGMGIGLSISRSIIERHEGQLWATSNQGPGATFSFSIPVQARRAP